MDVSSKMNINTTAVCKWGCISLQAENHKVIFIEFIESFNHGQLIPAHTAAQCYNITWRLKKLSWAFKRLQMIGLLQVQKQKWKLSSRAPNPNPRGHSLWRTLPIAFKHLAQTQREPCAEDDSDKENVGMMGEGRCETSLTKKVIVVNT